MTAKPTFLTLQAGRAAAALLVVLYHASTTIFQTPKFWPEAVLGGVFNAGHVGVHYFFVLSGFIILAAHHADIGKPERVTQYAWRRFSRVYPTYWIVLAPIVVLYLALPGISKPELASPAVIENSFLLIGANNNASLAVAWTLFHEVLFYSLFAVLIVHRKAGLALFAVWFAVCFYFGLTGIKPTYHFSDVNLLFGVGMLAYLAVKAAVIPKPLLVGAIGALSFVGLSLCEALTNLASLPAYGAAAGLSIAGFAAAEMNTPIRIPRRVKLLGDASFSIYLVHYPALSIIARVAKKTIFFLPEDVIFLVIVAAATIIGLLFYLFIERPLSGRISALSHCHRPQASRA